MKFTSICLTVTFVAMGGLVLAQAQQRRQTAPTAKPSPTATPAKRFDVSSIPVYGPSSSTSSPAGTEVQPAPQPSTRRNSQGSRLFESLLARNYRVGTMSGQAVAFNRVLGEDRPTVVIFWSTYCGVCYTALDDWQSVFERYSQRGLNVVALNVQDPGERDEVRSFMSKHHLGFPVYFAPRELHAQMTEGRLGTPVTFVFDRDGNLAARLAGWTRGQGRQHLESLARGMLAE